MTRTISKLIPFVALVLALALDPLASVTDAQDGDANQAPGEAPRPDAVPRGALLTGDVQTDVPLGPIAVRVERVPGAGDHVRLVAKGGESADVEVEVKCVRTSGSLASRMGPRAEEVATERLHVRVGKGEVALVALATAAPVPAGSGGEENSPFVSRTWWSYQIRLLGSRYEHAGAPYETSVGLVDAPRGRVAPLAAPVHAARLVAGRDATRGDAK